MIRYRLYAPLLFLLWLLSATLPAQTPAPPPAYDCSTASFTLSTAFQEAYESGDLDSARVVLQRWGELCGMREVTNRAMLLMGLRSSDVFDIDYLSVQLDYLVEYRSRRSLAAKDNAYYYEYNRPYYGFLPIGGAYDRFTRSAFDGLGSTGNAQFDFLSRTYGTGEAPALAEIGGEKFRGTALQDAYLYYRDGALATSESHAGLLVGLWTPLGDAAILGNHPEIGFAAGKKIRRLNWDLNILFRFLKSNSPYAARRDDDDAPEMTDKFLGGHMGATVGYDVWVHRSHEFQVFGGLGFDGFDALEETDDRDAASVISYAGIGGASYRKYLTPTSYLGLSLRAYLVNYRLGSVVDFNGVPLSLTVTYGSVNNPQRTAVLNELGYPIRQ